jgi:hypothetical protein
MKQNENIRNVFGLLVRLLMVLMVTGGSTIKAIACDSDTMLNSLSVDEVKAFFHDQKKTVLTFIGYSGAEYEDPAAMLEQAAKILDEFDSETTLVNIGVTIDGIGAVYEIAKQKGFTTTGIVSTQAKKYNAQVSSCVDHAFFIEDESWGGLLPDSDKLAPTSATLVAVSDVVVGIGGGEVGRDELLASKAAGRDVRFYPADMNHQKAIEKAEKKGQPLPTDFSGAAGAAF